VAGPFWFQLYSDRTRCPECLVKISLECVEFTPAFPCPHCGKDIRVSDSYKRSMQWVSWTSGLLLAYLAGARYWFLLLCWTPSTMLVLFTWMYIGKYFLPPPLARCVLEPPSILGLGPK